MQINGCLEGYFMVMLMIHSVRHDTVRCEELVTLDGSQYIYSSMVATPINFQRNSLIMAIRTSLSTCVLFFASGMNGDYIGLELYRGKLRFVSNSGGVKSTRTPSIEIIHGTNIADGKLHQVVVEIGETTRLYEFSEQGKSIESSKRSNEKDFSYTLDEHVYYMGMPFSDKVNTNGILYSNNSYEGCVNFVQFNEIKYNVNDMIKGKSGFSFKGRLAPGCQLNQPVFLKSFSTSSPTLSVFSHYNVRSFFVEFYYRTYLQDGILFSSKAQSKPSSVSLDIQQNRLTLNVTMSNNEKTQLSFHDRNADDGIWRKITVNITSTSVFFSVDRQNIRQHFNESHALDFPNQLIFGKSRDAKIGFIGCMKNIRIGEDKTNISQILRLPNNLKYEEKMCRMKDLCFPKRPCKNAGRCVQTESKAICNCKNTGFTGAACTIEEVSHLKRTCSEYYAEGFKKTGIYTIKPGASRPFKVKCDMESKDAPMTIVRTNNKGQIYGLNGEDKDADYFYHHITYRANKRQISDLADVSKFCRQYFRYDCYQSTLLNSLKNKPSQLGVRWYSRRGLVRDFLTGDGKGYRKGCSCGKTGHCVNSGLLCNCDANDQVMRFDEGFITSRKDLPISKVRVSILNTNQRSAFTVGDFECTDTIPRNAKDVIPASTTTTLPSRTTGESNEVSIHVPIETNNETNPDTNHSKTTTGGSILIDSKWLYIITVAVVILIILCMLILIFKRRICCCYREFKAKPQIVEYKDEISRNNNKHGDGDIENDTTYNVDGLLIPMAHPMTTTYPVSCSDSSVSTIDPGRYYQEQDPDTYSLQSNKSNLSIPKKSILKIKKDCIPPPPPPRKGEDVQKAKEQLALFRENYNKSTETTELNNRELDTPETKTTMSPLKQKVLELSTRTNQKALNSDIYFYQDSNSSIHSSSCTSSKESELNSDVEINEELTSNTELEPLTNCYRSKSVRFSDEDSSLLRRTSFPEECERRSTYETGEFLFSDEQKTLV